MVNLLYSIALILFFIWAISYIGYNQSGIVHLLLVVAIIAVIYNIMKGTNRVK